MADGLWERLLGASLVPLASGARLELPAAGRTVIVVDAVINTGRSLCGVLNRVQVIGAARILVVAFVGYRPSVVELSEKRPEVDFVAARLSERSCVGRRSTNTGVPLFGTATWEEQR